MSESSQKIIILDSYDTSIQANLAKIKLDAYGIPCFLTDENFVNLYPIRNSIFPGARLHVFEQDKARAQEVLAEDAPPVKNTDICPRCHSANVTLQETGPHLPRVISLISGIMGLLWPVSLTKKVYKCQDCGAEL